MSIDRETSVARWLFLLMGVSVVALLISVYFLSGAISAIKGGYVLLAVVLAVLLYVLVSGRPNTEHFPAVEHWGGDRTPHRRTWISLSTKLVYIITLSGVATVSFGVERQWVILSIVPVGYGLLGIQLLLGIRVRLALIQVITLYLIGPITKYLSTGFYFGATDTFIHLRYIDLLLSEGSTAAFPEYQYFPGLHMLVGILSTLTGLSTYNALMMSGLVAFSVALLAVYLFAVTAMGHREVALFIVAAASMLDPVSYFATYFFPQSLAVVLFVVVIYLTSRPTNTTAEHRAFVVVSFLLGVGLVITHHLTFVLVSPIVLIIVAAQWDSIISLARQTGLNATTLPQLRILVLATVGMLALTYWSFVGAFVEQIVTAVAVVFTGTLFASDAGKPISTYVLGTSYPDMTPAMAFGSLLSPEGEYFVVLTAVFIFGAVLILGGRGNHRRPFGVLIVGIVSAGVVLRTPLAINGLERARLPFAIFFAFVVGIGFYRLFVAVGSPNNRVYNHPGFTAKMVVVVLFVSLGTTGVLVAGDDLYGAHSGADLYELQPLPEPQVEMTSLEYQSVAAAARFIDNHASEEQVTTLEVTRRALFRFGTDVSGRIAVRDGGIQSNSGLFVYRHRWVDHRVTFSQSRLSTSSVVMSKEWLNRTVSSRNKIFTTGEVGILWTKSDGVIRPGGPATVKNATALRCPPVHHESVN